MRYEAGTLSTPLLMVLQTVQLFGCLAKMTAAVSGNLPGGERIDETRPSVADKLFRFGLPENCHSQPIRKPRGR